MKRKIIVIIVLLFILLYTFSKEKESNFLLSFSFCSNPFLYDGSNSGYIYSFIGNMDIGFNYNNFLLLFETNQLHYKYNEIKNNNLSGYFNILNFSIKFGYILSKNFILKFGAGFGWERVDFLYKNENILFDYFSPLLGFDSVIFFNNRYINFEIINFLNIFIQNNRVSPFYNTIFRINIYPYVNFFHFFIDNGIMVKIYKNGDFTLNSLIFLWSVGIKFDLKFPEMIKKKKVEQIPLSNKNDYQEVEQIEEYYNKEIIEEKIIISERDIFLAKFYKSKENDIININILFNKDNSITDKNSLQLLDWLIEFLKEDSKLTIAIGAYAEFTGNPNSDIEKSKIRANVIKNYLVKNGIKNERLKIFASGRIYDENIKDNEKFIDIKILKK